VNGPIFLAGASRCGKSLLRSVLAESSNIAATRRCDMWPRFYRRFGDLAHRPNLDRCLAAMMRRKQIAALRTDLDAVRSAFAAGPPSYERLFALVNEQFATRGGKSRWLDQTATADAYADEILCAYPDARIVHLVRDPRDCWAALLDRSGTRRLALGRFVREWTTAASRSARNEVRHPDSYLVVRYEDVVTRPAQTVREICEFVGEPFSEEMLELRASPRYARADAAAPAITAQYVGVHRSALGCRTRAHIHAVAGTEMRRLRYEVDRPAGARDRVRAALVDFPVTALRTARRAGGRL